MPKKTIEQSEWEQFLRWLWRNIKSSPYKGLKSKGLAEMPAEATTPPPPPIDWTTPGLFPSSGGVTNIPPGAVTYKAPGGVTYQAPGGARYTLNPNAVGPAVSQPVSYSGGLLPSPTPYEHGGAGTAAAPPAAAPPAAAPGNNPWYTPTPGSGIAPWYYYQGGRGLPRGYYGNEPPTYNRYGQPYGTSSAVVGGVKPYGMQAHRGDAFPTNLAPGVEELGEQWSYGNTWTPKSRRPTNVYGPQAIEGKIRSNRKAYKKWLEKYKGKIPGMAKPGGGGGGNENIAPSSQPNWYESLVNWNI